MAHSNMDHSHMNHGDMDMGDGGDMCSMNVIPPIRSSPLHTLKSPTAEQMSR